MRPLTASNRDVAGPGPGWQCAFLLVIAMVAGGCAASEKTLTYFGEFDPQEHETAETRIESPKVDQPHLEQVAFTGKPRTLRDRHRDEIWDVTLMEAIHLALVNNRIAKTRAEFQSPGNPLYTNPEGVSSVYDPAIRDTGVLIGTKGVESALSAFDTAWSTSMLWNGNSTIQNNPFVAGGLPEGQVLNQDTATFSTGLSKNFGYGANLSLSHNWNYNQTNQPFQLFPSVYTGNVQLNYVQPLWAGAGAEFTRIAGPLNTNVQGLSGVNQGVVIARINTDITIADFEAQVRNMVKDVEDAYWDLYLAYRTYDSVVTARNAALQTWRVVKSKRESGLPGGGAAEEAQARESYFDARSRAEAALGGPARGGGEQGIYSLELQLRRLCGLAVNDGRVMRPIDEPQVAEFIPDWHISLAEALTRREELRRQKWNIKSLELQLRAAESLANPQLNFVSNYQINGFGNDLFGENGPPGTPGSNLQSAYRTLAQANQTGWGLGFQFSMPLGMRNALSQIRNTELRLMKARDVLAAQELEVSHELGAAFQSLEYWSDAMGTQFNRYVAAEENYLALEAEYGAERTSLEFLLQGLARRVTAEAAYHRSVAEHTKAICEIHYRKGTLLENNSIHLAEGAWTPAAYKDALRRAWARSTAFDAPDFDPIRIEPEPFVETGTSQPMIGPLWPEGGAHRSPRAPRAQHFESDEVTHPPAKALDLPTPNPVEQPFSQEIPLPVIKPVPLSVEL